VRPHEIELDVERLCLDSTSYREIRERSGADPAAIADRISEIVASRGKMHNPATDSGGVVLGTVAAVGDRHPEPPQLGERIVSLASLTLTPLRIDSITRLDPGSPQIALTGAAYLFGSVAWGPVPDDLPLDTVLELYDVCSAGSHVRELAPPRGTVYVLGAGHAGKLTMAAARDAMEAGTVVAVDVDSAAVEHAAELGLCDLGVTADLRDAIAAAEAVRAAGAPPSDLTVVVVNSTDCEATAILLTAEGGTVMFFSMATSFSGASLAADGIGKDVTMHVGSGYAPDHGAYAIDLARRSPALRAALGIPEGSAG
jgi:L-erythro-3,5-diaminohexanoate dehydrogenase